MQQSTYQIQPELELHSKTQHLFTRSAPFVLENHQTGCEQNEHVVYSVRPRSAGLITRGRIRHPPHYCLRLHYPQRSVTPAALHQHMGTCQLQMFSLQLNYQLWMSRHSRCCIQKCWAGVVGWSGVEGGDRSTTRHFLKLITKDWSLKTTTGK